MAMAYHISVKDQASELFHDLTGELKEEIHDLYTGEQPAEQQADLIVRKHLIGLIILLFVLTVVILLASMGVIVWYGYAHS